MIECPFTVSAVIYELYPFSPAGKLLCGNHEAGKFYDAQEYA